MSLIPFTKLFHMSEIVDTQIDIFHTNYYARDILEFDEVQYFSKVWKQREDYLLVDSFDIYLDFHFYP